MPEIPSTITDLYTKLAKTNGYLPQDECERLIDDIANTSNCAYLNTDAFDECIEPGHRKEFLRVIRRLSQGRTLRVLITSRPHLQDINEALRGCCQLTIEAKGDDIRSYLHQELVRHGIYDIAGS